MPRASTYDEVKSFQHVALSRLHNHAIRGRVVIVGPRRILTCVASSGASCAHFSVACRVISGGILPLVVSPKPTIVLAIDNRRSSNLSPSKLWRHQMLFIFVVLCTMFGCFRLLNRMTVLLLSVRKKLKSMRRDQGRCNWYEKPAITQCILISKLFSQDCALPCMAR